MFYLILIDLSKNSKSITQKLVSIQTYIEAIPDSCMVNTHKLRIPNSQLQTIKLRNQIYYKTKSQQIELHAI